MEMPNFFLPMHLYAVKVRVENLLPKLSRALKKHWKSCFSLCWCGVDIYLPAERVTATQEELVEVGDGELLAYITESSNGVKRLQVDRVTKEKADGKE